MKSPRRLLQILISLTTVTLVGWLACSRTDKDGARAAGKEAPKAVPVLIGTVEKRDIPIWLEGLGTVAAWKQVTVRSQVDGRLDKVLFKEGQAVKQGDLLAQIDPRPFLAQLHQAEGALARDRAQLKDAHANLERYKTLREQNLIAQQQQDDQAALAGQAQGSVQVDEAAVETAKLNVDYTQIKAPMDGVVGVRLVDPGNLVHASDANGLVVLTQLDPMAVYITLPEDDLPRVSAAVARGDVPVEAFSRDGNLPLGAGKLRVIDNQINQATATLRLKAELPNPARKLWPNQFVKARLLLETRHDALVLPAPAVQRGPQGTFVYVVGADQTAVMRPIEIELTTGDLAVVRKGVAAGDQVVTEGQNQLRPGAPVQARPKKSGVSEKP
jgi:multidrug efflux system membrane fusion protein